MARKRKPVYGFHITTPIAAVVLLMIVFVSLGYFFLETISGLPQDNGHVSQQLEANLAIWRGRRPASFRYVVDRDCDCPRETRQPYVVTEVGQERQASFPVPVESDDGKQLQGPTDPIWIDDTFTLIATAEAQNQAVTARFHPELAVPVEIIIRQNAESVDTIATYEIRDIEILDYR